MSMKNWLCAVAVVLALGRAALAAMDANTAANIRDIQLLKAQLIAAKAFSNLSTSDGTARATKLSDTVTFKGYSGVTASAIGKVFRLSTPSLQSKALQSQYSSHRAAQWSTLGTAAFTAAAAYDPAGAAAAVTTSTIGAVPTSRTVAGHALTSNVTITASDVGALASGGTAVNASSLGGTAAATVVAGAAAGATALQSLPTATSSVLGGVKPDGTSILNKAGVLSATAASVGALASGGTAADSSKLNGQSASYYAHIASPEFTTSAKIGTTANNIASLYFGITGGTNYWTFAYNDATGHLSLSSTYHLLLGSATDNSSGAKLQITGGLSVNGTNTVYYCNGGANDTMIARTNTNALMCPGGTWIATSLKVD